MPITDEDFQALKNKALDLEAAIASLKADKSRLTKDEFEARLTTLSAELKDTLKEKKEIAKPPKKEKEGEGDEGGEGDNGHTESGFW